MGSILQIFDLNQGNLSRKFLAHKKHGDGFEAPRNSLEFSIEAPPSFNIIQDDIPYSCQVRQQSSQVNICPNGTPIKKLIDEEMLKRTNGKRNTPNVVARLMGMDNLPSEVKPTIYSKEWKDAKPRSRNMSSSHLAPVSIPINNKPKQDLLPYALKKDSSQPKLQPQEHPQEEVLQKFKREFAEWQASRVWEHSSSVGVEDFLRRRNVNQILAQENLTKEKIARYCGPKANAAYNKPTEPKHCVSTSRQRKDSERKVFLQHEGHTSKQLSVTKFEKKQDRSSSATRIVILMPSSERNNDASPEILEKEGSMQDFLEEVKERLKSEMLGKARNNTKARDIITEASFGERSPDTRQFARHIARKIRDSVTRDIRTTLVRSESTRSYRSEFQAECPESAEFINRDSRRPLAERMKNVVRTETVTEVPQLINERSRIKKDRIKSRSIHDFSRLGKNLSYLEDKKTPIESRTSYIGEQAKEDILDAAPVSPRNLVRSFSAPVCGTAFGRLLLEDQHVLTGAHIRRKHEAPEPLQDVKKKRKEGFNLKGTVSNFRHNFTLRGKLFGKKTQSIDEPKENGFTSLKSIVSLPSVVEKFGIVQDNSTEVPPSPASVSSCSQDEFYRQGNPSPVSPLEAPFIQDQSASKLPTEISQRLSDSGNLSERGDHVEYEEVAVDEKPFEDETIDVECNAECYLRDILVAAGLYEADTFGGSFPGWDASTKPIANWVFDEVEETYSKKGKLDDGGSLFCYGDINLSCRMLFDLANEALPIVVKAPMTTSSRSKFKNWVLSPNMTPHGKRLLDGLWCHIRGVLNSSSNDSSSIDDKVEDDVRTAPWFNMLHEDVDVVGRKLEVIILGDLISELIQEMLAHGMK